MDAQQQEQPPTQPPTQPPPQPPQPQPPQPPQLQPPPPQPQPPPQPPPTQLLAALLSLANACAASDLPAATAAAARFPALSDAPSPLHLAAALAPAPFIPAIAAAFPSHSLLWINARFAPDLESPLHIAARLARADALAALLALPGANDALSDASGRAPLLLARSHSVAAILANHRLAFVDSLAAQVRSLAASNSHASIAPLFDDHPRAAAYLALGWFDINAPVDPVSERCILHLAARADDLNLVSWALIHAADPNVKDKKGKRPLDLARRDKVRDRIRSAIPQAPILSPALFAASKLAPSAASSTAAPTHSPSISSAHASLPPSSSFISLARQSILATSRSIHDAPVLRGSLFKWTNYTSGYKSRYFVLENGTLSYYHSAQEYPHSCRGSVSTLAANITMPDSNDSSRFDITTPGNIKYSVKARSPADAKKWIWYLMESKRLMADLRKLENIATIGPTTTTTTTAAAAAAAANSSILSESNNAISLHPALASATATVSTTANGFHLTSAITGPGLPTAFTITDASGQTTNGDIPNNHRTSINLWDAGERDDPPSDLGADEPPIEDPLLNRVSSALDVFRNRASETTRDRPSVAESNRAGGESTVDTHPANASQTLGPRIISNTADSTDSATNQRISTASQIHAQNISTTDRNSVKHPHPNTNIHTLMNILEVQLSVQERVVATMLDIITSNANTDPAAAQLPSLLKVSLEHIQDTAKRIVRLHDVREKMWTRRLYRESEARRRWEEVMSRVVGIDSSGSAAGHPSATGRDEAHASESVSGSVTAPGGSAAAGGGETETIGQKQPSSSAASMRRITTGGSSDKRLSYNPMSASSDKFSIMLNDSHLHHNHTDSVDPLGQNFAAGDLDAGSGDDARDVDTNGGGEDEVFYDANDGQGVETSSFLEQAFGFTPMDEPTLPRAPTSKSQSLAIAAASPATAAGSDAGKDVSGKDAFVATTVTGGVEMGLAVSHTPGTLATPSFLSYTQLDASNTGYIPLTEMRKRLPLDPTKPKPTLAVWSFLKSAIGKDLSKVTLPVFFNEPLSMLQRMCEDVEYISLLGIAGRIGSRGALRQSEKSSWAIDAAARSLGFDLTILESLQGDDASLLRVMLVAAYAMSNYSSTVGRTNKPFNPMLGETYELVNRDIEYRYLSEQVCHHPPISACFCDSPAFTFWTEVNVKSKFWGRSLELHPLGTCHASLPIFAAPSPTSSQSVETGGAHRDHGPPPVIDSEHYSWKKVTTTVNNLIVGKLSIDHSGDMVVRNWRTGEACTITFKPRDTGGWFGGGGGGGGSSSSGGKDDGDGGGGEIVGHVKDASGKIRFELKGRWDDTLTARVAPGAPLPTSPSLHRPITLWRRTPPPQNSPQNFNFTEFALMLNDLPESLRQALPPTDSRLRPDQQAMERGEWDAANTRKERLELYQRERRKKIMAMFSSTGIPSGPPRHHHASPSSNTDTNTHLDMGEAWWIPRWFTRQTDPDTGEGHWQFTGEYWSTRHHANSQRVPWPEYVDDIFGLSDPKMNPS